jgi:hypothetical protein
MKVFNVTRVHTISPEEIPGKFVFDVPIGGEFYFTQDEDYLYLYLQGDTEAPVEQVEGIMLQEGEEIPPGYTVDFLAHLGYALVEEEDGSTSDTGEPVWAVVAIKDRIVTVGQETKKNSWKKTF